MTATFNGRREDQRFLTGQGRYTADWTAADALFAAFRRSDVAHARIAAVDCEAARAMPGVVCVLSAADFPAEAFGTIPSPIRFPGRGGSSIIVPPRPVLARDRVRFVGEEIAVVIAQSPAAAQDAAERIEIQYEDLPALVTPEAAVAPGALALHDEVPGNVCFDFEYGDAAQTQHLLATAAHRVRAVVHSQRVSGAPMEPRSVLAWYDATRGTYEIRCSNQGSETMTTQLAAMLRVDRERIRMHVVDVGGGFGPRNAPYPEYAVLLEAARRLGRPIRWSSTRSEDLLCDSHGRGIRLEGELALDANGTFLALRTDWLCDQGAYLTSAGPVTNTVNGRIIASGGYLMQAVYGRHRLVVTNANPQNAYRGAGRPEANLIVERLVDEAARALRTDPLALRRRNALGAERFPHKTPTGSVFDSGDYQRLLDVAARESRWAEVASRRADATARGRLYGVGCALFVEPCGGGFLPEDQVALAFAADGRIDAHVATTSNGQGHETVYPAVIAARLGIDAELVTLRASDPDGPPIRGNGSIGSRSMLAQGSALAVASDEAARKGKEIAARMLEASAADLDFTAGRYVVRGTDLSVGFVDVVREAAAVTPHPLDTLHTQPSPQTFTSGLHVAEVEIDPETGETQLVAYHAVDDMGNVVNEVLAEAQVAGGVAQAAGQVLGEHCVYDADTGQMLTGTFMDYAMPRADTVPGVRVVSSPTASPTNALGAKGAGEAGTTGGIPAILNAVLDALSARGVPDIAMPATPARVWAALQAADAPESAAKR
jgi:carbon-monoxide dehydrogenase large subunit